MVEKLENGLTIEQDKRDEFEKERSRISDEHCRLLNYLGLKNEEIITINIDSTGKARRLSLPNKASFQDSEKFAPIRVRNLSMDDINLTHRKEFEPITLKNNVNDTKLKEDFRIFKSIDKKPSTECEKCKIEEDLQCLQIDTNHIIKTDENNSLIKTEENGYSSQDMSVENNNINTSKLFHDDMDSQNEISTSRSISLQDKAVVVTPSSASPVKEIIHLYDEVDGLNGELVSEPNRLLGKLKCEYHKCCLLNGESDKENGLKQDTTKETKIEESQEKMEEFNKRKMVKGYKPANWFRTRKRASRIECKKVTENESNINKDSAQSCTFVKKASSLISQEAVSNEVDGNSEEEDEFHGFESTNEYCSALLCLSFIIHDIEQSLRKKSCSKA